MCGTTRKPRTLVSTFVLTNERTRQRTHGVALKNRLCAHAINSTPRRLLGAAERLRPMVLDGKHR
jgi:hypothetical protein